MTFEEISVGRTILIEFRGADQAYQAIVFDDGTYFAYNNLESHVYRWNITDIGEVEIKNDEMRYGGVVLHPRWRDQLLITLRNKAEEILLGKANEHND